MGLGKDSRDAGTARGSLRVKFIVLWASLCLLKIGLAMQLPPMVDEAFYAWEGRHPALAYSDLPGLTAWLARIGMALGGGDVLALRLPFLLLGACLPWLVVRIATRWFGPECGWWSGILSLLMPLSALLGILALPDVPLVVASLLCLDGIASLRERIAWPALALLALALVAGALSHYRFALVLFAGGIGLCCDDRARRLFADKRFWVVLAMGAMAWFPLLYWNIEHAGAGIRFQVVERNPWVWDSAGAWWLPIQLLLVTPVLFALLVLSMRHAVARARADRDGPWRLLLAVGGVAVWGFFLVGFFADRERVSFHWPLAGWLVWIIAAPVVFLPAARWFRLFVLASAGTGLLAAIFFLATAASPALRKASADMLWYPASFAGTEEIIARIKREKLPPSQPLLADNVGLAAQLAFAMPDREILVLDHPRNHKHGRAAQLQLWHRQVGASTVAGMSPGLLVVEDSARAPSQRLGAYRELCAVMQGLPRVEALNVDHGRKRYLLFRGRPGRAPGDCPLPALAWIDLPLPDAEVGRGFDVSGWAFKDGAGIARVEILLDGKVVADADYGVAMPNVAEYWKISSDPAHPKVGFRARVDLAGVEPGAHWLGLRLHGKDGSREDWPEQAIHLVP